MKKTIFTLLIVFLSITSFFAQEWETDFETAKEISLEKNIPIVLVFQGSDWCAPCMKLEREIWSTAEFKLYAKANLVMLQADFPRKKKNALAEDQQKKNTKLAEKYNKQGYFPFVVVLDNQGNVLGELGYEKTTPAAYVEKIKSYIK